MVPQWARFRSFTFHLQESRVRVRSPAHTEPSVCSLRFKRTPCWTINMLERGQRQSGIRGWSQYLAVVVTNLEASAL